MMENWEQGTRNRSGAKVRTYGAELPRLRMSTPRSGYVPFQYRKAYGCKSATGLAMTEKCTPAKTRKDDTSRIAAYTSAGRRMPENIAAALFVAVSAPQSKNAVRKRRHAIDVLRDFVAAETNRHAISAMISFERNYATEKVCGETAATHATVMILVDGLRRAGYAIVRPAHQVYF